MWYSDYISTKCNYILIGDASESACFIIVGIAICIRTMLFKNSCGIHSPIVGFACGWFIMISTTTIFVSVELKAGTFAGYSFRRVTLFLYFQNIRTNIINLLDTFYRSTITSSANRFNLKLYHFIDTAETIFIILNLPAPLRWNHQPKIYHRNLYRHHRAKWFQLGSREVYHRFHYIAICYHNRQFRNVLYYHCNMYAPRIVQPSYRDLKWLS